MSVVAGKFTVAALTPMGSQKGTFEYFVDGDVLTGKCVVMGVTAEITGGKVEGNTYSHPMTIASPMGVMDMTVIGTVDGDDIQGEFKLAVGKMPFKGTRDK